MTEYKCGNCKEVFSLSPKARFCPECGSSSLNLIIKEAKAEPSSKETVGVYTPSVYSPDATNSPYAGYDELDPVPDPVKEEEDQPRKKRR